MTNMRSFYIWLLCVTVWVTLFFIVPDFTDSPVDGLRNALPVLAYIGACGIGSFLLLYLIGTSRYVSALMLPITGITGAALAFYRIGYRTTLTPMLIDATIHTNAEEAAGVLSWSLLAWVCLNLCIACVFVAWRWKKITLPKAWLHGLIALLIGIGYMSCNNRLRNGLCQRFPYNIPYNVHEYLSVQRAIQAERTTPAYSVADIPDTLSVVLIFGEATRADHLQLNGYRRETTPRLSRRKNIVSYPHIYSEQTHTLASLPYLLTRADSIHDEYQYTESSFVSIFREAGFQSSWLSNQDLGSTFSPFLAECDTVVFANAGKSVYVFSPWLDEDLIPVARSFFAKEAPRSLCILHTIGSHWYYNNHVPEAMQYYQPVTTNRVVTANPVEELVNSYDNTILYMDYWVDSLISLMEDKRAIVIYQSDHGEALGEDNEYLHANETEMAKHPACFVWYSDLYAATYPDKIKALVANKDKRFRTDYLYYSILYAAGIEAEGDVPAMNIFR